MKYRQLRLWAPVVFWIFQFIIHIIRNIYKILDTSFSTILDPIIVTYPLDIFTFSLFYFFFAVRLYRKESLTFYVLVIIIYVHAYSFVWAFVYYKLGVEDISQLKLYYFSSIGHSLLYAFYGIMFRFAIDWFENREKRKDLEQQNIKTELALLRSKVNPHFLFNILNSINSFTTTNPEKASYAIIKLSELMRYMLYEAKEERVLVEKEINYIENYLSLQKLRFNNPNLVSFSHSCDTKSLLIPPMLLIPFIENAFKHGKKALGHKIDINLKIEKSILQFECTNGIRQKNETEKTDRGGFGIENIKRRLELQYPNKHQLTIESNQSIYRVKLIISLYEN